MRRCLAISLASIAVFFISLGSAHAQTFILTGQNDGGSVPISIDLVLSTTPYTPGNTGVGLTLTSPLYDITNITGSVSVNNVAYSVTGFPAQVNGPGQVATVQDFNPGPGGGANFDFDDLLSQGSPYFDFDGIAFDLSAGAVNISYNGTPGLYYWIDQTFEHTGDDQENLALTLTETPEPASMLLFGTGLLVVGLVMRKKVVA